MYTSAASFEEAPKLLLVEDERLIALDLEDSLEKLGFQVAGSAHTGQEALDMAEVSRPDLVLMDIRLQGQMDGIRAASILRDRWDVPVVFLTANSNPDVISRAKQASAYGFLTKPFRTEELDGTIRVALHRHQVAQELLREHTWFTTMLGSLSDGVIATDADGNVRYVNPAAGILTGWTNEEARGRVIEEVYPLEQRDGTPLEHCQLRKALLSRAPIGKQRFCLRLKNGSTRSVEDSATPILDKNALLGAVTVFQDVSKQEKAEQALRETEKLAMVSRLASSISHEINNPLAAITNLLYLAEHQLTPESPVLDLVQQANAELARITHVTTETLRFHRQSTRPTEVQMTSLLESALTLHQGRTRGLQVAIERRYRSCRPLTVFENEIRQVLANLIGNALDAMIPSAKRRLVLRVCEATDWRTARRGVRISVADTGGGMSVHTIKNLFKPFFTTKAATGTGLGLWISAGIIEKHGGRVNFRSSQDMNHHGTVFSIFLPRQENSGLA